MTNPSSPEEGLSIVVMGSRADAPTSMSSHRPGTDKVLQGAFEQTDVSWRGAARAVDDPPGAVSSAALGPRS